MRMSLQKSSVLDALRMLSGSWLKVLNNIICDCWRRPSFILASQNQDLELEKVISSYGFTYLALVSYVSLG